MPTLPFEFNSPRDHNGHGTHTATTAGGNAKVRGHRRGGRVRQHQRHRAARPHRGLQGLLVGARHGRLLLTASTCWRPSTRPWPTASTSSTTRSAARRRTSATRSRSPSCSPPTPACSSRLRPATAARPPARWRIPGPWLTTVAAGTHNRDGGGSVTLGNGVDLRRRLGRDARRPAPLIDSTAAGLPGADPHRWRSAMPPPTTAVAGARSGQGRRQDRRLRPRRDGARQQEPGGQGGRRRRHDPGQHPRQLDSTPTSTSCRPCTCRTRTARPSRPTRPLPAPRPRSTRRRSSTTRRHRSPPRSRRAARCAPATATC